MIEENYTKIEYIKNVSLDLKVLILDIASLLQLNENLDRQKQENFAQLINAAIEKFIELINSLMALDVTEYQTDHIKKEKVDLLKFSEQLKALISIKPK